MYLNERSLKDRPILILKIKEKLSALKKHKDIKCVWIPAHMGNVLSKIAKESIGKGEDARHLIPVTDFKSHWKTKLRVAVAE
jgi:hypothetical protein